MSSQARAPSAVRRPVLRRAFADATSAPANWSASELSSSKAKFAVVSSHGTSARSSPGSMPRADSRR